jgi:integrase
MDYVYCERNVSAVAYNNYLKVGRAFFNWAKEKCYVKENPFETISKKQKTEKKRVIIPDDYRKRIADYLLSSEEAKNYLIALKLIYSALLRPSEIRKLRVENLDMNRGTITVPAQISKNKKQRIVTLTCDVINDLKALSVENYPGNYYLLGKDLRPNSVKQSDAYMRKYWDRLRTKLKLPKEMQQYSFRDTGIFDMLKSGIDDLSVMQHANHSSLAMTTVYANHVDPNLANIIREKSPQF